MRWMIAAIALTALTALGLQSTAEAQWTDENFKITTPGLFGPRTFGESIRPKPSRYPSGLLYGPGGNFRGRNPDYPGLLFRSKTVTPEAQPIVPRSTRPIVPFRQRGPQPAVRPAPRPSQPPVVTERPSDILFRSGRRPSGAAAPVPSSSGAAPFRFTDPSDPTGAGRAAISRPFSFGQTGTERVPAKKAPASTTVRSRPLPKPELPAK